MKPPYTETVKHNRKDKEKKIIIIKKHIWIYWKWEMIQKYDTVLKTQYQLTIWSGKKNPNKYGEQDGLV